MTTIKITKTYVAKRPNGELVETYALETTWLFGKVVLFGNRGFACPEFKNPGSDASNGYFWNLQDFMRDFYSDASKTRSAMRKLKLNESTKVSL